jgi:elongation factor P
MIETSQFRIGTKLEVEGKLYEIVDFQHARTAQRRANVWTKMKNLETGQVLERSFAAGAQFDEPDFEEKPMQFLYIDGGDYVFMDSKNYDQVHVPGESHKDVTRFLTENMDVKIQFYKGKAIAITLPSSVELRIVDTQPGVRGDTVTSAMKPAKLESGAIVDVPLFVNAGDKIKVDTRTGKYIERAR